jgi:hypothetical protein
VHTRTSDYLAAGQVIRDAAYSAARIKLTHSRNLRCMCGGALATPGRWLAPTAHAPLSGLRPDRLRSTCYPSRAHPPRIVSRRIRRRTASCLVLSPLSAAH